jgi:hypothetical protein
LSQIYAGEGKRAGGIPQRARAGVNAALGHDLRRRNNFFLFIEILL